MKARVWIEQEIEVDVSAQDAVNAIMELDDPDKLPAALSGISACHAFLRRVPASLIAEMNEEQREIIVSAFEDQAARYKTPNAKITGAGTASGGLPG